MTFILTHPVVQGAITFPNALSGANSPNPFSLESDAHSHNTLSLSINVHLTTYYSSNSIANVFSTDPSPAPYSSPICDEKKNNNSSHVDNESDATHAHSAQTTPNPHEPASFLHLHQQSRPFSRGALANPDFSSSLTILNTISNYYEDDENSIPIQETTNRSRSPSLITNNNPSPQDWTQLGSPTVPVTIDLGKPLFRQVLEREMAQQIGAMAVSVCGPGGMGDEVRKAVRDVQGKKTVEFFEESFSW